MTMQKPAALERPVNRVGPLAETPLAEIAKRIAADQRSGDLQVIAGHTIKTVYFDHGVPVGAASNLEEDRLGETLVEQRRLSRIELEKAMQLMKDRGTKLGRCLVDCGMISETELEKRLTRQARNIVRSMFAAEEGIYSFDERDCPIVSHEMLSLPLAQLMLEGTRELASLELIMNWLPAPDEMLCASAPYTTTVALEALSSLERALLGAVEPSANLISIMQQVGVSSTKVLHACYSLYSAHLLEPLHETPLSALFRKETHSERRVIDLLSQLPETLLSA